MKRLASGLLLAAGFIVWAAIPAQAQADSAASGDARPATTTFFGDTGLWFVPTGEVLPDRKWSISSYRANFDRAQGFTDFSHVAVTVGAGLGDRVEVFGSFRADTRIDRDTRPIFISSNGEAGGLANEYPLVRQGWSGNSVGDLVVGVKVNLLSEHRQQPVALAVRGMIKVPTGDDEVGASTGKPDGYLDAIVSKELTGGVELAAHAGIVMRGDPEDINLANGVRWGVGAGFPTRGPLRLVAELHGEILTDTVVTASRALRASDGSLSPLSSQIDHPVELNLGVTWQARNGFFGGAGIGVSLKELSQGRDKFGADTVFGDYMDVQLRLGYHPGAKVYVAPPPPPPPPPPPANRMPAVKARCEPCAVEVGKSSTVSADATDPDGDSLVYRWSAPTGVFATPSSERTTWTAPAQDGAVPATVTVDDGRGGTAADSVTIQVTKPAAPVREYVFEDVHFDFDRYTLRPEAASVLDEAVAALTESAGLRVEIEGHTCNIGTTEYNLALGERRASAVREYLTSRGVSADRLRTVSYGEERPRHDNTREETRRLNRRAALVVRIQ